MATYHIISGNVIQWKVVGSQAVAEKITPISTTVPEGPEDRIKQRLLADWLKGQDPNDVAGLLDKMGKGLITIEITVRTPVTPPPVNSDDSPEARIAEAVRELIRK